MEKSVDHEESALCFRTLINEFYKDSDDESSEIGTKAENVKKPSAIITNFKPFELEKSLVIADHILVHGNKPNISTSLGDIKEKDYKTPDNSFCITESELINCCHQAEKILENANPNEKDNEKKIVKSSTSDENMDLINSILEDFSQSPLDRDQILTNMSWEHTPEFRLRMKPVKCYSRKFLNSKRANLNERFAEYSANVSPEYNDDDCSNSSSLSVQEDVTIEGKLNETAVTDTDNSQRVCENLLNLSKYFTQNQLNQNLVDEEQHQENTHDLLNNGQKNHPLLRNIPDLIKDILHLRLMYPTITCDTCFEIDNFYGFPNDEDDKANVIDVNKEDVVNTILDTTQHLNVCDIRFPDTSPNKDNTYLHKWSEDDDIVVFAGIDTELFIEREDGEKLLSNERETKLECPMPKTASNNINFIVPEIFNQKSTSKSSIDFKTEHSSREAQMVATNILSKIPEEPSFKNINAVNNCDNVSKGEDFLDNLSDYDWNEDCDLFQNFQTPSALKKNPESDPEQPKSSNDPLKVSQNKNVPGNATKVIGLGFKTANGKNVHISKKAQNAVQQLFTEFSKDLKSDCDYAEELREIKNKAFEKTHILEKEKSSISDIKRIQTYPGFQTGNGKNITISLTAQQNVEKLLNEFRLEPKNNCEESLESMKEQIHKKNEAKRSKSMLNSSCKQFELNACKNIDFVKTGKEESKYIELKTSPNTYNENNAEFHIGNSKSIDTSVSQKCVQKHSEYSSENATGDNLTFFKSIGNSVNKTNNPDDHTNTSKNVKGPRFINADKEDLSSSFEGINNGFKTANGKNISTSSKATEMVKKLLQEFSSITDFEHCENDLKVLKSKMYSKRKELKENFLADNKSTNAELSQRHSSPKDEKKLNLASEYANIKRKYSTDSHDLESPTRTPLAKIYKHDSHTTISHKSPLVSTAHSVIVKKNLLSLTKRRKSKINILAATREETPNINKELYDLNVDTRTTPNKSCSLLKTSEQAASTPNFKEFFLDASQTSTPQIKNLPKQSQIIADSDLKPIIWENTDDSINNKSANIPANAKNSSKPTAKERISRLKMYGQPPAVSPILIETHNNCRPSGLRRTSSMLRRTEK